MPPHTTKSTLDIKTRLQLAPLFIVIGGVFGGALVIALLQSLGFAPWFGINTFPDFSYFTAIWQSPGFWAAFALTLYYAFAATLLALIFGTILALTLRRAFPFKNAYKYIYKLPLMIPYTVGIALAILMLGNGGMLSRLAALIGLIDDPAAFPQILHTHYGWGIIAVYVWKQLPFVTLSVYAVLLGIGRDTQEAAALLGAPRWRIFTDITLPQILPGIVSASLIVFAFNMGAFEAPFILGGGYPDTLPVLAWRYFNDADYTRQLQGMAVIVSLALTSGALLFFYIRAYRRFERRIGRQ